MTEYEPMRYHDWQLAKNDMVVAEAAMMRVARKLMLTNANANLLEIISHVVRLQGAVTGQIEAVIEWYNTDQEAT